MCVCRLLFRQHLQQRVTNEILNLVVSLVGKTEHKGGPGWGWGGVGVGGGGGGVLRVVGRVCDVVCVRAWDDRRHVPVRALQNGL